MRVTNGMIINTSLNGLYNNMNAMNKTYAQMATGKKIQTVSDDPIVAGRALKLKTTVLEAEQYESNLKEAMSWMEITESSLGNMSRILKTIRTKCVQASTGTLNKEDLLVIQTDIKQLWKQLQEEANTTYAGRYIFSGFKTDQKLVEEDKAVPPSVINDNINTKDQDINYEVGVGSTVNVNVTGMEEILKEMEKEFNGIFSNVENSLADENIDSTDLNKMFTNKLEALDKIMQSISEKTSDLGSRMNRVEYTQERLSDQKTVFKNLLSETEDIDIEEVYTNFNVQYATYQSALQATAKVIKNTLADYL